MWFMLGLGNLWSAACFTLIARHCDPEDSGEAIYSLIIKSVHSGFRRLMRSIFF